MKKNLLGLSFLVGVLSFTAVSCGSSTKLPLEGKVAGGVFKLEDGTEIKVKDTYNTTYVTESQKERFNYLTNTWTYNSEKYTNMVDGLVENDKYGAIKGALAESWTTGKNADGDQTWTFVIKKGVKWVKNKSGKEYADVKAEDFVTGLKYVLTKENGSGTVGVVTAVIKNAAEYYRGNVSFDKVGVKAVKVTVNGEERDAVEYTLIEPTPYFLTNLTYSPFLPVNADYLKSQGTDFGATENNILVNGAFRMTKHTTESKIVFTKNASYWDRENVWVNTVNEVYVSGESTADTARRLYEAGTIDGFTVTTRDATGYKKYVTGGDNGTGTAKAPADPSCNAVLSRGDATYIGYFNFNRTNFEYTSGAVQKTEKQQKATATALLNKNIRKGVLYGLDISRYLAMINDQNPYQYLMRSYTIPELAIDETGKDYVDYVNEVYNEKKGTTDVKLNGFDSGKDPILDQNAAKEYLKTAKAELISSGKLTEADFPVYVDVIGDMSTEVAAFETDMYQDFASKVGEDVIKFNTSTPATDDQNTSWGSDVCNFDFSMWSGWGPDYADPNTFLHTMCIGGDMVDYMGFEVEAYTKDEAEDKDIFDLEQEVLGDYDKLYRKAAAITDSSKITERYQAFAEAEYQLIYEDAVIVPWYTKTGYYTVVSKVVPYQACKASYGLSSDKFKCIAVAEDAINQETRAKIKADYEAHKA